MASSSVAPKPASKRSNKSGKGDPTDNVENDGREIRVLLVKIETFPSTPEG